MDEGCSKRRRTSPARDALMWRASSAPTPARGIFKREAIQHRRITDERTGTRYLTRWHMTEVDAHSPR